tara:strand:- start:1564 stop:1791 length:228 start_codon:yes stop_codon:yes gene_type:complete
MKSLIIAVSIILFGFISCKDDVVEECKICITSSTINEIEQELTFEVEYCGDALRSIDGQIGYNNITGTITETKCK